MAFAISTKKIFSGLGILLTIISTTLIQARAYIAGYFYGDPFDGRLMIVLHEHWWHFLRGERPFLDTYFFYPFDRGLGFSDVFFLQGFFYSAARWLNFDLVDSWALATISILVISNIGLALLAKQTIKNYYLQISFVLIAGSSFTFFAFMNMYPNVAGYGLVSFLAYFFSKLFKAESNNIDRNIGLFGISLTFPLLLLTAWYAAFFSALFILIYAFVQLISNSFDLTKLFQGSISILKTTSTSIKVASLIVFTMLTALWLYIYVPVASDVDRTIAELQEYSIKLDQLLNGSALGGGVFKSIYQSLGYMNFDQLIQDQNGITISLFFCWLILGFYFISQLIKKTKLMSVEIRIWVSLTIQFLFFLQVNSFSLFQFSWELIPAFKAIRVSSRMLILVSIVIIFLLIRVLDNYLNKTEKLNRSFILLTPIILTTIFIDQVRFEHVDWSKENYLSTSFTQQVTKAKSICKAFYLNSEGEEWWNDQLTAMILSSKLNFPTVNGYSGGYPNEYPAQPWRSKTQLNQVVEWLKNNDVLDDTCLVRTRFTQKLNSDYLFYSTSGFDLLERAGENIWWWSKQNESSFAIVDLNGSINSGKFVATLEKPPCQEMQEVTITNLDTGESILVVMRKRQTQFQIPINFNLGTQQVFNFSAKLNTCKVEGDPRDLYYSVKNPQVID